MAWGCKDLLFRILDSAKFNHHGTCGVWWGFRDLSYLGSRIKWCFTHLESLELGIGRLFRDLGYSRLAM